MVVDLKIVKLEDLSLASILFAVIFLAFTHCAAVAAIYNRRMFYNIAMFFLLSMGISHIIDPYTALHRSTKPVHLDGLHCLLGRCFGVQGVFEAFRLWISVRSSDVTPRVSFLWSWLVKVIGLMMAQAYFVRKFPARSSDVITEDEFVGYSSFVLTGVWAVLMMIVLFKTESFGGYAKVPSRINTHLNIEYILLLVGGLSFYAFPRWLLSEVFSMDHLDKNHIVLNHLVSAGVFSLGIMSGQVVHYLKEKDKAYYLGSRVAMVACLLLVLIHARFLTDLPRTPYFFVPVVTLLAVGINAAAGYASVFYPEWVRVTKKKE